MEPVSLLPPDKRNLPDFSSCKVSLLEAEMDIDPKFPLQLPLYQTTLLGQMKYLKDSHYTFYSISLCFSRYESQPVEYFKIPSCSFCDGDLFSL